MLNALCTASMNVSDIVILAVLAVGIVAGIIAGFAKLLNGTIGGIIAFIAAICLGIFLAGYLAGVSAFVDLQAKISDFFVSKFDVAGYKAKVSNGELFLNVSGSAWTSVSTLFEGSSKLKIALLIQTVCVKLFSGALTGSVTLAAFAANLIVKALCALIVFVASIIVLEILFSLLSKLLSKIVEKQKRLPQRRPYYRACVLGGIHRRSRFRRNVRDRKSRLGRAGGNRQYRIGYRCEMVL